MAFRLIEWMNFGKELSLGVLFFYGGLREAGRSRSALCM